MFELWGKQYSNEQEIITGGLLLIYWYCFNVRGRWRGIEHLMIKDELYGYWYARNVIKGRYEPELETLYVMRNSGSHWVRWYINNLITRQHNFIQP